MCAKNVFKEEVFFLRNVLSLKNYGFEKKDGEECGDRVLVKTTLSRAYLHFESVGLVIFWMKLVFFLVLLTLNTRVLCEFSHLVLKTAYFPVASFFLNFSSLSCVSHVPWNHTLLDETAQHLNLQSFDKKKVYITPLLYICLLRFKVATANLQKKYLC